MRKKHWAEIDVLYTIGTILVVLGHSHPSDWNSFHGTILETLLVCIYSFHMPLFFFIAGFLFMNSDSLQQEGYTKWLSNKAKRLLTPYVILSVAALIPKYYFEHKSFTGFSAAYLLRVLLVPRVGVWGHFWFLPVLLLLYVLFGLWKPLFCGSKRKTVALVSLLCALVLCFLPFSTQWFGFSDFKQEALFFLLGVFWHTWLYHAQPRTGNHGFLLIVPAGCLSVLLARKASAYQPAVLCSALLMLFSCWQIAVLAGDRALCRWISSHNFTIYIYSWPFQAVIMTICGRYGVPWYVTTVCMLVIGILAPVLMIVFYERLTRTNHPFLDLVLGVK